MVAPYEKDKPLLKELFAKVCAEAAKGDAEALEPRFAEKSAVVLSLGEAFTKREFLAAIANGSLRISAVTQQAVDVRISFDGRRAQITGCVHANTQAFGTSHPAADLHVQLTAEKQHGEWSITDLHIAGDWA